MPGFVSASSPSAIGKAADSKLSIGLVTIMNPDAVVDFRCNERLASRVNFPVL
jgi:hypothetical protein